MWIAVWTLVVLAGLVVAAVVLLGRSRTRITGGRIGRTARLARLSAYLSTSWLGAKLRRLFAGKERRARYDAARRRADAEAITKTMGQMKGVVMKVGQMLSFVTDAIPIEYRSALQSLQASAPPMDFAQLRDVAEQELGMPLERAFASFDEQPLAAASIGQVHRARLASGEEVVVKIQYPGVADAIRSDLANVGMLYRAVALFYPGLDPKPVIEELRARILEELDYVNEARNQQTFADLYADHPFIRIPKVYATRSTKRVLVSEYVKGRTFSEVLAADEETRDRFGEILYRFVFGTIGRHAAFNGDPHPGNYLYDDRGRVVFVDFGCVKYFPAPMLRTWLALVAAHLGDRPDEFRALATEAGFITRDSKIATDVLFEYFSYYYEPFRDDRVFRYTPEYNARSVEMMLKPKGRFAGIEKLLNIPRDYTLVNRLSWGVASILSQLGATANWHRIHREVSWGGPPSTPLGELDHAWAERRAPAVA